MSDQSIIRGDQLLTAVEENLARAGIARFATGSLFLPGLLPMADSLDHLTELRMLIGNLTWRESMEQLMENYHSVESVSRIAEAQKYPKRTIARQMTIEAAVHLRESLEMMEQSSASERLIHLLERMLREKRLTSMIYTRGRLETRAYIFDGDDKVAASNGHSGSAIVGAGNITLPGALQGNELHVLVRGEDERALVVRWFDALWKEGQDFAPAFHAELEKCWALADVTPYDIYLKTLYSLIKDRLADDVEKEVPWDDEIFQKLADFQKIAVRQAIQIIKDVGGVFVSDVVGLGKSFIGAAIVKHFERSERVRPLIICPASLVEMWERYNETYDLHARVLSMGQLRAGDDGSLGPLLSDPRYRDRDFILLDESHNFRHADTQRYRALESFLATGRKCCFLTATPRNKSVWDIYNQLKLFHPEDKTQLAIDPPNLREFFRLVEGGTRKLPTLLTNLLIRRTRNHVLIWYGFDAETDLPISRDQAAEYLSGNRRGYVFVNGRKQFFPRRELRTLTYSIEDAYQGLYQTIRGYLGRGRPIRSGPLSEELTYARYGLFNYVLRHKQGVEPYASLRQAGSALRGLIRILLFKRFESSVEAFRCTISRLIGVHESFLTALERGIVAAGEEAQSLLYASDQEDEEDLIARVRRVSGRYDINDFNTTLLREHLTHDLALLRKIEEMVEPITPANDAKLQVLLQNFANGPLSEGKRLIFTEYADTARYLFENLNPDGAYPDIEVIYSGEKSKERIVGRFAPRANPEYRFKADESELSTVVATDVLSEGLNLQDCDKVINYDLHWNPVRLIQRFGRIDRIGSTNDVIYGFNFLPEAGLERELGLRQRLANRISEIHETIGEDAAILDPSEQIQTEAMYAIYEADADKLALFERSEGDELTDINEAEEIIRQLRDDNPAEYERIVNLRDGVRCGRKTGKKATYVLCEACTPVTGEVQFQRAMLLDPKGRVLSSDLSEVLTTIRCDLAEPAVPLPPEHNQIVTQARTSFGEEMSKRWSEQKHSVSQGQAQRYVLRDLRSCLNQSSDEEQKEKIETLIRRFSGHITAAVRTELNRLRRGGVTGPDLVKELLEIFYRHEMSRWVGGTDTDDPPLSRIICAESMV